jgi:hypothetical protein
MVFAGLGAPASARQQRDCLFSEARPLQSLWSLAFAIFVHIAWMSAWIHRTVVVRCWNSSSGGMFHPIGAESSTVFKSNSSNEPSTSDSRLSMRRQHWLHRILCLLMLMCQLVCHGAAQTVTPSPTVSPSTLCAAGWSYYSDSDGSEGQASCLKISDVGSSNWIALMTACPRTSHLLTMAGMFKNSGLHAFLRAVSGDNFWVGASQSSAASSINRGWAWIDGTSSANLNCGAAGDQGCGLWAATPGVMEPK